MKARQNRALTSVPRRSRPAIVVESQVIFLRHQRVILDEQLAKLYGVSVKRLNEQIKRNRERFPSDFMFQLTAEERDVLRSQIATSKTGSGGRRYTPYAFTEHGAIMAATVLNSDEAVAMSVFVVRAFVRLREMLATNRRLAIKIDELENRINDGDRVIGDIIRAIRKLLSTKRSPRRRIGFQLPDLNAALRKFANPEMDC
ncbi:MAG TPA: ORF6N domain-containing protein [Candidatus Sulfotelmatobacter sp.]